MMRWVSTPSFRSDCNIFTPRITPVAPVMATIILSFGEAAAGRQFEDAKLVDTWLLAGYNAGRFLIGCNDDSGRIEVAVLDGDTKSRSMFGPSKRGESLTK